MQDEPAGRPWPDALQLAHEAIAAAGVRRAEVDLLELVVTIVGCVHAHASALLRRCPEIDGDDVELFADLCQRADLSGQTLWRSFAVFGDPGLRVRREMSASLASGRLVRQLVELLRAGEFAAGPLRREGQLPELAS